jgi:hypothetical protein
MKLIYGSLILFTALLFNPGCKGKSGSGSTNDTISVSDTGFTGIKKYMSGGHVSMETTFKNGVKDGLTTTYYASGKIRGTLMYQNGLREDSAKWFFEEGQIFRTTPYKRDTVDGIQKQYFRNGKLKAVIGYSRGARTFEFEEFDMKGRKIVGYPDLVVSSKDEYSPKGIYSITLSLSDRSNKVKFYRGDFGKEIFDSTKADKIKTIDGKGILDLKKTGTPGVGSVDVVASIITFYGNSFLVRKKIELPYKDLN